MASLRSVVPVLAVLAAPAIAHTGPSSSCVVVSEPPMVTEVAQVVVTSSTAINEPGIYTLTHGHTVEVVTVVTTTVCPITSVSTKTTTYPCSTSTTYTSCPVSGSCETPTTFCWSPNPTRTRTTSCPAKSVKTVTATQTVTRPGETVSITEPARTVTLRTNVTITDTTTTTLQNNVTITETATTSAILTVVGNCSLSSSVFTSSTTSSASSTSTATPGPTLSCDKYGYLIQSSTLYRVDVSTGKSTVVKKNINAPSDINAIGYNALDNFLYGWADDENSIIRLSATGTLEYVYKLQERISGPVGDVDSEGFYWYATGAATTWYKHDLRPGSPTYGERVGNGTTPAINRRIFDWVHIPSAGNYLWSIGTESPNGGADLMFWSMTSHRWVVRKNYPKITTRTFGALYAINNGTIYASDNDSGYIYSFDINGRTAPRVVSHGPISNSNDGARCVLNLDV